MKKIYFIFFWMSILSFAQSNKQVDSLATEYCKEIQDKKAFTLFEAYDLIINKLNALENINFVKDNNFYEKIYSRFFMNCPKFAQLMNDDLKVNNPELYTGVSKIDYQLTQEKCKKIFENDNFYYKEIRNDKWVDTYKHENSWVEFYYDGSTSNLKYEYHNDCKIKLTFINTNNEFRKNTFFENDVFYYHLVNEKEKFYDFVIESPSNGEKYLLKFFKEKQ